MVNHSIKVYARLKREDGSSGKGTYEIVQRKAKFDDIIFYNHLIQQGNTPCSFRFHKVFDQDCNQEGVFDTIAKPVINSVLQGFNGTIFAYGQTGSGKTYTITGSPKNYNDRGIIPRSIQYIFAENEKLSTKPTIYISYMEIYNEVGYDLLSSRQNNTARSLEDLPRIALLEDGKGEAHIRNLSVLPVTTEQEAMRLLFLGDTNRTIAETPMNEYSSRSHCIFTIYITFRNEPSNIIRFSKLHLVDLAGSERVSKSLTTGTALNEAKHINLSLHYLQQVILALSESKRSHIPYRNSMMTYLLKDSLSGNCLTAMLATLAVSKSNVQETLSTCRFAQRVSLISTEPVINEICDPHQEIVFLKNKIEELRKQIALLTGFTTSAILNKDDEEQCKKEVDKYLNSDDSCEDLKVKPDFRQIQYCFKLLRCKINSQNRRSESHKLKLDESQKELSVLKETVDKKDAEINTLRNIIDNIPENPINPNRSLSITNNFDAPDPIPVQINKENIPRNCIEDGCLNELPVVNKTPSFKTYIPNVSFENEREFFDKFMMNPENSKDLNYYTQTLERKWKMAKIYAETIEQCQNNIICVRQKLQMCEDNVTKNQLLFELEEQQNIYRKSLADLKTLKNETDHLQSGLKQAEIRTMQKFRVWLSEQKPTKSSSMNNVFNGRESTEFSRKHCENSCCSSNLDILQTCCNQSCFCRKKGDKKLPLNCCSTRHLSEALCADCKKTNICLPNTFTKNYQPKKSECCICSCRNKEPILELHKILGCSAESHTFRNDPTIFKHAFNELTCMNHDLLKKTQLFEELGKTLCIQREKSPIFQAQGCQNFKSDCIFDHSNDLFNNINGLVTKAHKSEKNFCDSGTKDADCHHEVNLEGESTKLCCQIFCCKNPHQETIHHSDNRSAETNCEHAAVKEDQDHCSTTCKSEAAGQPEVNTYCEYGVEEEIQQCCEGFCCENSSSGVGSKSNFNVNHKCAALKEIENQYNDCPVQTHEVSDVEDRVDVIAEASTGNTNNSTLFKQSDSAEFREFMKTVPLTGEPDIDEEIYNFYRNKFCV